MVLGPREPWPENLGTWVSVRCRRLFAPHPTSRWAPMGRGTPAGPEELGVHLGLPLRE